MQCALGSPFLSPMGADPRGARMSPSNRDPQRACGLQKHADELSLKGKEREGGPMQYCTGHEVYKGAAAAVTLPRLAGGGPGG
eukprot:1121690-Alexandrium_andersonii.AAC.1